MSDHPPPPVQPVQPVRLSATAARDLAVPMAAVRQALLTTVRQAGLTVTVEQLGTIDAQRGSRFGGLTLSPEKVPVRVRADIVPTAAGCRVELRVEDAWTMPGRSWGAVSVYRTLFEALTQHLDRAVARVDPAALLEPWHLDVGQDVAAMQSAADVAARARGAVGRRTDRVLEGNDRPRAAGSASGLATVELASPTGVVRLDVVTVDAMLTTGRLVVDRPGGLPTNLLTDVQSFVLALEAHLDQAGRAGYADRTSRMELTAGQVPVVGFLFQQSRLREQLPLRLLTRCTTCRLEKVVNPDLARLRERARRSQALTSSMGMFLGGHGASPYVMLGRMAHLRKSEPDYVCPRCQGLDADECVVTFCPQCGERRDESVLRTCPRCAHDFRALDPTQPAWQAPAPVAA
ncbi:hypothetical protein, partial [Nocardioides sp.]|uniref:hypothetical protein n=1 Tax=Nocardioides sp. TaxID=35761 RepID=UPI00272873F3